MPSSPAIYRLPPELFLHVAFQLPNSTTPKHLKALCLVSTEFRAAAQEALHNTILFPISCGCRNMMNPVIKLLRTLFDRPDLRPKVKFLRFKAVRKSFAKLCRDQNFDLPALRTRCLMRLAELGYQNNHPWSRSLANCIESAFAGVLLTLVPNLVYLDSRVLDHSRGLPSDESTSGLFGTWSVPDIIAHGWNRLQYLATSDINLLKCGIEFNKLTSLDLKTCSIATVLKLNGPGCLQGTKNLRNLGLSTSIQFADSARVEKADIQFSDILDALDCKRLNSLKIVLVNDGYHNHDAHELAPHLEAGYFMDQLTSVQNTLKQLHIAIDVMDEMGENWMLESWIDPKHNLDSFTSLKRLVLPQALLFGSGNQWNKLRKFPSTLESLEILYPLANIEDWITIILKQNVRDMQQDNPGLSNLKQIILTCRDQWGSPSKFFTEEVKKVWWTLSADFGIETYVNCQTKESRLNLAGLYHDQRLESSDENDELPDLIDLSHYQHPASGHY